MISKLRRAAARLKILPLFFLFLAGCATYAGVGSQAWYDKRMAELESAHQNNQITHKEYLSLKNEVDNVRVNYLRRDAGPHFGIGYGAYHRL